MEDFEFDIEIEEVLCFYAMAVIYRVIHKILWSQLRPSI